MEEQLRTVAGVSDCARIGVCQLGPCSASASSRAAVASGSTVTVSAPIQPASSTPSSNSDRPVYEQQAEDAGAVELELGQPRQRDQQRADGDVEGGEGQGVRQSRNLS